jgi:hypothetical protein
MTFEKIIELVSSEEFIRLYNVDTDKLLYKGRLEDLSFGIWRNLRLRNVSEIYPDYNDNNNNEEPMLPYLCIFVKE